MGLEREKFFFSGWGWLPVGTGEVVLSGKLCRKFRTVKGSPKVLRGVYY